MACGYVQTVKKGFNIICVHVLICNHEPDEPGESAEKKGHQKLNHSLYQNDRISRKWKMKTEK